MSAEGDRQEEAHRAYSVARRAAREFARISGIALYEAACADVDEGESEPDLTPELERAYPEYKRLLRVQLRAQLAWLESGAREDYPGQRAELQRTVSAMDTEHQEDERGR